MNMNKDNIPNCYLIQSWDIDDNEIQALVPFGKEEAEVFKARFGERWSTKEGFRCLATVYASDIIGLLTDIKSG
jgi:hypothetical protein